MKINMIPVLACLAASTIISVDYQNGAYTIKQDVYDVHAAACAIFYDTLDESGWMKLHIQSSALYEDAVMAHAAGIAEGYLNHHLYQAHKKNVISNLCSDFVQCENGALPKNVTDWFDSNMNWVIADIEQRGSDNAFGWGATMYLEQMKGIVEGHNMASSESEHITLSDIWLLHSRSEIFDVYRKLFNKKPTDEPFIERHGTSFMTLPKDHSDVLFGHSSWRSYGDAIRISKRYRMPFSTKYASIARRTVSSYPLVLHADEGFTITDMGLVISGTTIALAGETNLKDITHEGYPHWLRMLICTEISYSGTTWTTNYQTAPASGCGIEITVLDAKRFLYKQDLGPHLALIVDEVPGSITIADATSVLDQNDYFASFDVPYIEEAFTKAGYEYLSSKYPEMYSYTESARAKIIKSMAPSATRRETAKLLIRYNNISDPLQKGRYDLGISAREELQANGRCSGAIDAKFTTLARALHLHWEGASGPAFGNTMPAFTFGCDKCQGHDHERVPEELGFGWLGHYFDMDVEL